MLSAAITTISSSNDEGHHLQRQRHREHLGGDNDRNHHRIASDTAPLMHGATS
jgi:hypothetical protein